MMAVHCTSCLNATEGYPCHSCGWKPGDAVGPSPFDSIPAASPAINQMDEEHTRVDQAAITKTTIDERHALLNTRIIRGLNEAAAHLRGEDTGAVEHHARVDQPIGAVEKSPASTNPDVEGEAAADVSQCGVVEAVSKLDRIEAALSCLVDGLFASGQRDAGMLVSQASATVGYALAALAAADTVKDVAELEERITELELERIDRLAADTANHKRIAALAELGREHLQAGNTDDALTAFNRIRRAALGDDKL